MNTEALLGALKGDPAARLRWRVLCYFGCPPGGTEDRSMSDRDCLFAAANMVLDIRRKDQTEKAGGNPAFDEARFRRLKEGGA